MRFVGIILGVAVCGSSTAQPYTPVPEEKTDIGYPSPKAAEEALRAKPGVAISEKDGWLVVVDKGEQTVWTFALHSNRAYPTAVKRTVEGTKGNVSMNMNVQCGSSKEICDEVVRSYQALNDQVAASVRH